MLLYRRLAEKWGWQDHHIVNVKLQCSTVRRQVSAIIILSNKTIVTARKSIPVENYGDVS